MTLLGTQIQKRHYIKSTNINIRITSAPPAQNKRQDSLPQNEVDQAFTADENDFYVDTDDEGKQLEENVVFITRLEKLEAYKAEHTGVTEALRDDSQLNEAFLNNVHYELDYDSGSDQDRIIHGTTSMFFIMSYIEMSSLDPTCDNSQIHHELVHPDHLAMLQSYALLQAKKDKNACLEKKIQDML
ncbi:hypothetical protein Tco_1297209, partial [Tanacetum coccineum]